MTEEPWNKHTPGDPMPCKCGDSVVEVKYRDGAGSIGPARLWNWEKRRYACREITDWRFVERKGEDVIAAGPYDGPGETPHQYSPNPMLMGDCDICGHTEAAHTTDPYDALEWDEDGIATAVLKKPGQPWWVRDDDLVRFTTAHDFERASDLGRNWEWAIAFQIKRRPVLTPAEPQLLALLAVAIDDESIAIRQAARRANIEVPK